MKLKNVIYIMLCLCVAVIMSGCNSSGKNNPTPTPTTTPVAKDPNNGTQDVTIAPPENMEITIYSIDSDSCEKVAVSVLMSEVTPEYIVDEVVSAMQDEGFLVEVDAVIPERDTVIVSFKADAPPVTDVGASVEGTILDAIGQSILDNMSVYSKIIYRIEGGAYVTGHFELGIDEVYIGR